MFECITFGLMFSFKKNFILNFLFKNYSIKKKKRKKFIRKTVHNEKVNNTETGIAIGLLVLKLIFLVQFKWASCNCFLASFNNLEEKRSSQKVIKQQNVLTIT